MTALHTELFIDGDRKSGAAGRVAPVEDPATGQEVGTVALAEPADVENAIAAANRSFPEWRATPARQRAAILHGAAELLRERTEDIAAVLTREQGKPLAEASAEIAQGADVLDWFAGEAIRSYGRTIPSRGSRIHQEVRREPVGPVAAFAPWNFPINQLVRKLAAALAAGCSVVAKGPEETPGAPAALVAALTDAGAPAGAVNLLFGDPPQLSAQLVPHPAIRKISFTGSTVVGKELAALAGRHMKRATMELGGHAPVIVCADADVATAATFLAVAKYRNAGQVCVSPTRFLVHADVYDAFVDAFVQATASIRIGSGFDPDTTMGPLANIRRVAAMQRLVGDALDAGAQLLAGGTTIAGPGHFYPPTVLADVPPTAAAMNEEPFGPLALIRRFTTLDEAILEANRLSYGLAAYAATTSAGTLHTLAERVESGMLSVNHAGVALPETPNGGVKDSGYGAEGGSEAIEAYQTVKFVTHAA
jgi:succinate-semialdehyde dehydrogenase / glutarate-semialdehyde dehydrogenase